MSLTVFLDSGPLSLITNPKKSADVIAVTLWLRKMSLAGHRFAVPAVADYEVRRELIRARKTSGLALLDAFNAASPDRFLSISDSALQLAAQLWAGARNTGMATADPKELDADVLIAAQVIGMGIPITDFVVATTNVSHLSRFVPADLWTNITP